MPPTTRRAGRRKTGGAKKRRKSPTPPTEKMELPEVDDEETLEFLRAIDAYKRASGRPFPTWSEILAIAKSLGYRKEP